MSGINKVILVGNVGKDPEIRNLPNGGSVANFSVATSEAWKDKQSGEKQERTEWHRIVIFQNRERGLVDIVEKYVTKGMKVYVEGKIQTRKWTDKDGIDRYSTEIVVDTVQMLSGGRERDDDDREAERPAGRSASGETSRSSKPATKPAAEDFDDDIPF